MSTLTLTPDEQALIHEYRELCHAMQTGVNYSDPSDQTGKHLRTGINTCQCDHAALVELLINLGVIDRTAYFKAIRDMMQREVLRYQDELARRHGKGVTLL